MAAQGGVGSRIYSFGNTSGGGGGGGGSAAFRPPVEARDSVNALKPTGSVVIDGAPINITGQRVLFTNLSGAQLADNNKVFAATVAAGLVTAWTLQTDGQAGDGNPTDGDNLYVRSGTVNGDREVFYNGTAWFIPAGGANTALSNLTATGINVALVPNATGTLDLGSAPLQWRRINVQQVRDNINNTVLDVNNRILNDSANATALNFSDATNIVIHKNFIPNASGSRDLGSTTAQFRDIFAANLKDAANTVILDMSTRFLGDSAGGPVLDFSNATNTIFYKNILPSSNNTLSLGSSAVVLSSVWSTNYRIGLLGNVFSGSTPSGTSVIQLQAQSLGGNAGLTTVSNSTPDAVPSGSVYIESGNKTAGTGNSGDIFIRSGTSTGGTRGNLFINVPSLTGSSAGWVWSLQDPATGRGAWAAVPAPTGSNNTVAYFNGAGALSSEANFSFNTSIKSFSIYSGTGTATASGFSSVAWGRIDNASASITSSGAGSWAIGYATGVGGQIDSQDAGTFAGGFANVGKIVSENSGSFAFGNVGSTSTSRIRATTGGGMAFGSAGLGGIILSSAAGAIAMGYNAGGNGAFTASGTGSHVFGMVDSSSPGAIIASSNGAGARGFSQNGGIVQAITGTGAWASGSAVSASSTLSASAIGAHVFGAAASAGQLLASSQGSTARGNADNSGVVRARLELGAFASGHASGASSVLQSEGQGAHSFGNVSGGSTINCNNNGAFASGSATGGGAIRSEGAGSLALGNSTGASSLIQAANNGSVSFGNTSAAGTIRTTGAGSLSFGRALNTSALILGQGAGAMAFGYVDQATAITASGTGSFAGGAIETSASNTITASGVASFAYGRRHNVSGNFATAFGEGHTVSSYGAFVVGQFADATGTATASVATEIAFAVGIGTAGTPLNAMSIGKNADIKIYRTITAGGVTGDQTINRPAGTVNFAAAATTLTVTNNLVTASSIVFAVVRTNDATAVIKNVVPAAGSFVINLEAAATAETSVGFFVLN